MKKFLILMIVFVSNLLLLSACSSDNDESGDSKARYYIKYTVTGGSWYRPPFGHTSNPSPTTIKFQDKNSIVTESQSGSIKFTKVVGPVNNKFKASLSVSGTNNGSYSASYETIVNLIIFKLQEFFYKLLSRKTSTPSCSFLVGLPDGNVHLHNH